MHAAVAGDVAAAHVNPIGVPTTAPVEPIVSSLAAASVVPTASEETAATGAAPTTAPVKPTAASPAAASAASTEEARQSPTATERDAQATVPGRTSGGNPVTGEHCPRSASAQCATPPAQRLAHLEQTASPAAASAEDDDLLDKVKSLLIILNSILTDMLIDALPKKQAPLLCSETAATRAALRDIAVDDAQSRVQVLHALVESAADGAYSEFREAMTRESFRLSMSEEDLRLQFMADHFNEIRDVVLQDQCIWWDNSERAKKAGHC